MSENPADPGASAGQAPLALNRGELWSAISAVLLLVLMFAVAWYGVDGIPGGSRTDISSSENAWRGLTLVRWLMLLTVVVALGTVAMHVRRPSRFAVAGTRLALLVLATVTAALLIVRVFIDLPSPDRVVDQKLGAVLAVLAALGVVLGAYESVREQRARMVAAGQTSRPDNRAASSRPAR
jgi:hypothetical protein